ncbi:MAG TPA: terpene cyclase/mutase family protein [Gemmatales bacterium]|nr:terpene cyclase/mutase family protein [Gemmatales bacterium]
MSFLFLMTAALFAPLYDDPPAKDKDKEDVLPKPKKVENPASSGEIDNAIKRGIAYLLENQNKDGSWGNARNTKDLNIYAPTPASHLAYRGGCTALVVCALCETATGDPVAVKALEQGEKWIFEKLPDLRRDTPDVIYNIWGHAYGIKALVRMYKRLPDDKERQEKIKKAIAYQIEMLGRYESVDGGWGYYDFKAGTQKPATDATSFITATVLIALKEADELGVKAPEKLIKRGVASIERQRKKDNSYLYGEYLKYKPMIPVNRPAGSLGRSQACNLALRQWGDKTIDDNVLVTWLDRLYARNMWLDIGRKRPVPHEAYFQIAGYFFYYGHYYGSLCIDALPEKDRPFYQEHLVKVLLPLQEKDGSWWDYPLYNYHYSYGTAYTLMALKRAQKLPVKP